MRRSLPIVCGAAAATLVAVVAIRYAYKRRKQTTRRQRLARPSFPNVAAADSKDEDSSTGAAVAPLTDADYEVIDKCYSIRDGMRAPMHSKFRVVAVLTCKGPRPHCRAFQVVGTNCEIGIIAGSICAERSALVKLQLMQYSELASVHIVTDADAPITPGTLCREFMSEVGTPDTRIVIHGKLGCIITTLRELYPYNYMYAGKGRDEVMPFAKMCATKVPPVVLGGSAAITAAEAALYTNVTALTVRDKDSLHPIQFAAGVLFADGTTATAWQSKALEYGATIGAVSKLLWSIEQAALRNVAPVCLVQARALLAEHGYSAVQVLVHQHPNDACAVGEVQRVTLRELMPLTPLMEESLPQSNKG